MPHLFRPRDYQWPSWDYMIGEEQGLRCINIWHRRAGKDKMAINLCACKSQQRVGLYWHILPTYRQGRNAVWNGRGQDGTAFLSHFPGKMVDRKLDIEMRLHLTNGSIYQVVGSDDVDRLVGSNPLGCVFSEFALQDPKAWQFIEPILVENGGWAMFISTPRGRNHFYKLVEKNMDNPEWHIETLDVSKTFDENNKPVVSAAEIQKMRDSGTPENVIQQEFFCSFDAFNVGSIFGDQIGAARAAGRIKRVPFEPRAQVDTYWDIGRDGTAIIFCQSINGENRIIDFFEEAGQSLPDIIKMLDRKPYKYGHHWGPWDLEFEDMYGDQSRIETARALGLRFRIVPKHGVSDSIDNARIVFQSVWFDSGSAVHGLLSNLGDYAYEWDEKHQCRRSAPRHDKASHASDAFRYMCWTLKRNAALSEERKLPDKTTDENFAWV